MPSGPVAEAQGVLATGKDKEKEAYGVRAVGKEKTPKALGGAWVSQLLLWAPITFREPISSASKETRADTGARGRAHVPVDLPL